ncbi:MAG TPA: hypothetical protein PLE45_11245 [Spirochaetota bacterium]|nr:hypothetical protein [Spirochaetota bacterium]HOL57969.1 hypothetical protein [Spirochaetota bacterium]HPP05475.1 hypothetical protein [Spirochaetota bacterium]
MNELSEIKMGRGSAFGTYSLVSLGYYRNDSSSPKLLRDGDLSNKKINKLRRKLLL